MPPFLATDCDDILLDSTVGDHCSDSGGSIPPSVECVLFPDPENLQAAFRWLGPDLLSPTTQSEEIMLYVGIFSSQATALGGDMPYRGMRVFLATSR